jgi:hypothetical protein
MSTCIGGWTSPAITRVPWSHIRELGAHELDEAKHVSPLAVDLDVLVERKLGLRHGCILSEKY